MHKVLNTLCIMPIPFPSNLLGLSNGLPPGFKFIEYIESDSKSIITDVIPQRDAEFKFSFSYEMDNTSIRNYHVIFDTGRNLDGFYELLYEPNSPTHWLYYYNADNGSMKFQYWNNLYSGLDNFNEVFLTKNSCIVNGSNAIKYQNNGTNWNGDTLKFNSRYAQNNWIYRIKYFTLTNPGEKPHNFIPAISIDNRQCLIDLSTNKAYFEE